MQEDVKVVLVDEQDEEIGVMGKLQAHVEGRLHRAVSVFLFNEHQQMLLQQRAPSKYHSGGLWSNTCCSHPYPGEKVLDAAQRRLREEMGISCELRKVLDFIYKVSLDQGLTEHEFDHVFVGQFNGEPQLNLEEASNWKWIGIEELERSIEESPESYTTWFKIIFKQVISTFRTNPILCAK